MHSHILKEKCDKPRVRRIKDFFKQVDECHDQIEKDIEEMKATLNGDENWMRKEPIQEKK